MCSADPKGSVTGSQGNPRYISVVAILTFTYVLLEVTAELL